MNTTQEDLIYLLACAVNETVPDADKIQSIDIEKLYLLAKELSVRAAVCIALEKAGIHHEQFHDALKKAIRKNIFFEIESQKIFAEFENQSIWYMPMKGFILKDLYPENGMREMADCDILYDLSKQQEVKQIMINNGYSVKSFGRSNHDIYYKPPVLNYELHISLFEEYHSPNLYNYYRNIEKFLKKDAINKYRFHLSNEDLYIYMTAHEWKHFSNQGTGIRSLLDCYIYLKHRGESLDWKYIQKQMKLLEMADFEQKRRELAIKIFSSDVLPSLNASEIEMLSCYIAAGTYGTFENGIKNRLKNQSKLSFLMHSIFIPYNQMAKSVPFSAKSPLLYPVGFVWRGFRILLFRRSLLKKTIIVMKNNQTKV